MSARSNGARVVDLAAVRVCVKCARPRSRAYQWRCANPRDSHEFMDERLAKAAPPRLGSTWWRRLEALP